MTQSSEKPHRADARFRVDKQVKLYGVMCWILNVAARNRSLSPIMTFVNAGIPGTGASGGARSGLGSERLDLTEEPGFPPTVHRPSQTVGNSRRRRNRFSLLPRRGGERSRYYSVWKRDRYAGGGLHHRSHYVLHHPFRRDPQRPFYSQAYVLE